MNDFNRNRVKMGYLTMKGKKYYVYQGLNTIGRNMEATVIIKDAAISQNHSILTIVNDREHFISDFKSMNGTFVNNEKLIPYNLYKIQNDSNVSFSNTILGTYTMIPKHTLVSDETILQNTQIVDESFYLANTQIFDTTANISKNFKNIASTSTQISQKRSELETIPDDGFDFTTVSTQINDALTQIKSVKPFVSINDMPTQLICPEEKASVSKIAEEYTIPDDGLDLSVIDLDLNNVNKKTNALSIHELQTQLLHEPEPSCSTESEINTKLNDVNYVNKKSNVKSINELQTQLLHEPEPSCSTEPEINTKINDVNKKPNVLSIHNLQTQLLCEPEPSCSTDSEVNSQLNDVSESTKPINNNSQLNNVSESTKPINNITPAKEISAGNDIHNLKTQLIVNDAANIHTAVIPIKFAIVDIHNAVTPVRSTIVDIHTAETPIIPQLHNPDVPIEGHENSPDTLDIPAPSISPFTPNEEIDGLNKLKEPSSGSDTENGSFDIHTAVTPIMSPKSSLANCETKVANPSTGSETEVDDIETTKRYVDQFTNQLPESSNDVKIQSTPSLLTSKRAKVISSTYISSDTDSDVIVVGNGKTKMTQPATNTEEEIIKPTKSNTNRKFKLSVRQVLSSSDSDFEGKQDKKQIISDSDTDMEDKPKCQKPKRRSVRSKKDKIRAPKEALSTDSDEDKQSRKEFQNKSITQIADTSSDTDVEIVEGARVSGSSTNTTKREIRKLSRVQELKQVDNLSRCDELKTDTKQKLDSQRMHKDESSNDSVDFAKVNIQVNPNDIAQVKLDFSSVDSDRQSLIHTSQLTRKSRSLINSDTDDDIVNDSINNSTKKVNDDSDNAVDESYVQPNKMVNLDFTNEIIPCTQDVHQGRGKSFSEESFKLGLTEFMDGEELRDTIEEAAEVTTILNPIHELKNGKEVAITGSVHLNGTDTNRSTGNNQSSDEDENIFEMATQKCVDKPDKDIREGDSIFEMATQKVTSDSFTEGNSIFEMATQKITNRDESLNEGNSIFEMATQKICEGSLKSANEVPRNDDLDDFDFAAPTQKIVEQSYREGDSIFDLATQKIDTEGRDINEEVETFEDTEKIELSERNNDEEDDDFFMAPTQKISNSYINEKTKKKRHSPKKRVTFGKTVEDISDSEVDKIELTKETKIIGQAVDISQRCESVITVDVEPIKHMDSNNDAAANSSSKDLETSTEDLSLKLELSMNEPLPVPNDIKGNIPVNVEITVTEPPFPPPRQPEDESQLEVLFATQSFVQPDSTRPSNPVAQTLTVPTQDILDTLEEDVVTKKRPSSESDVVQSDSKRPKRDTKSVTDTNGRGKGQKTVTASKRITRKKSPDCNENVAGAKVSNIGDTNAPTPSTKKTIVDYFQKDNKSFVTDNIACPRKFSLSTKKSSEDTIKVQNTTLTSDKTSENVVETLNIEENVTKLSVHKIKTNEQNEAIESTHVILSDVDVTVVEEKHIASLSRNIRANLRNKPELILGKSSKDNIKTKQLENIEINSVEVFDEDFEENQIGSNSRNIRANLRKKPELILDKCDKDYIGTKQVENIQINKVEVIDETKPLAKGRLRGRTAKMVSDDQEKLGIIEDVPQISKLEKDAACENISSSNQVENIEINKVEVANAIKPLAKSRLRGRNVKSASDDLEKLDIIEEDVPQTSSESNSSLIPKAVEVKNTRTRRMVAETIKLPEDIDVPKKTRGRKVNITRDKEQCTIQDIYTTNNPTTSVYTRGRRKTVDEDTEIEDFAISKKIMVEENIKVTEDNHAPKKTRGRRVNILRDKEECTTQDIGTTDNPSTSMSTRGRRNTVDEDTEIEDFIVSKKVMAEENIKLTENNHAPKKTRGRKVSITRDKEECTIGPTDNPSTSIYTRGRRNTVDEDPAIEDFVVTKKRTTRKTNNVDEKPKKKITDDSDAESEKFEMYVPDKPKRYKITNSESGTSSKADAKKVTEITIPARRGQAKTGTVKQDLELEPVPSTNITKASAARGKKSKTVMVGSSDDSDLSTISGTPKKMRGIDPNASVVSTPERLKRLLKPKVVFTMFESPELESLIRSLGGSVVDSIDASTVLVTKSILRSQKLLCAVAQGKPICTPDWLNACKKAHTFLDPWDYLISDNEAEKKWNFSLEESLTRSKDWKMYHGYSFQLVGVKSVDVLKGAIENCGGKVVTRTPKSTDNFIVISTPENKTKYSKFLKQKVKVVAAEAIFDGVLKQELSFHKHLLN